MAIGDDAMDVGWDLVPESGEAGRVRWGAREINRTRDMAAQVYNMVPNSQTNFQKAAGIRVGTDHPDNLAPPNGVWVIYFRYTQDRIVVYVNTPDGWKRHRWEDTV